MPSSAKILNTCRKIVPRAIRQHWPRFKVVAAKLMDKNLRNMSSVMLGLKDRYNGERCCIMGTGPSLNRMDLELFKEEYVWAANKSYLLFDRISWRPSFYVAVDKRVVPDIAGEINHLNRSLTKTMFFFPARFREQWIIRGGPNVYWYREVSVDETNLPDGMFSQDASEWVSNVRTVTIAALQLAVYLGFNPIYLIGCDTSYFVPPSVSRKGDNSGELLSTMDDDPNHFDPRYFGTGSKWHEPHVDKMLFHYEQARRVCDSLGVNIYNATVGGNLEVFPRVDYTELF